MALQLLAPPSALPIDLNDAKLHSRIEAFDDDAVVRALIAAATDYAQHLTGKQLIVARWKQVLDSFPGFQTTSSPYGRIFSLPGNAILLRRHPVLQVVSIQYLDMQGATQTVDPSSYTVDYSTEPVRITPVFGKIWPIPLPQIGSVWVTFDAGYAAPLTAQGNNLTVRGWIPLNVGDAVRLSNSGGMLPWPLQPLTDYFVQSVVSPGVYTLAESVGGQAITLKDAGSGSSYLGEVPNGILTWMRLRFAALYENREEVAVMAGGSVGTLPYVDRLLDDYVAFEF